ncbi:MAG TPA: transglycosylase domain-containing protein, partial [Oscillospiraceae bacterium]|nr:transglycosylase domain-containing protein [Oscillospiraceae bacterium]
MAEDRKRGKRPRRDTLRKVGRIVGTILLIGLTTCVLLACFAAVYIKTAIMPQADLDLGDFDVNQTTVIYYTDKETGDAKELQTLYSDENRIWVNYEDLPPYLEKAAVAIEDKRFYKHNGVDLYRTAGAFVNMFLGLKEDFGASTITQQLIKNLTGYDEVTVKRKVIEIFRALEFDRTHSKEETIEWYLNYIYLGEGCRGVYTASYTYFGKNVSDLDLAECASLIAITNNPSIYSPYVSRDRNKTRQETILATMLEEGYITQEQHDQAVAEELTFQRGEDEDRQAVVYSWYVDEVIRDVTNDLQEEKGISEEAASRLLYSGGYKIYCCIDPEIQAAVDEVYNDTANLPYTSKTGQQMQSGIVIMDYDGNVVAMAGGMGEKSGSLLFNIATRSTRPPGSAIKPLSVYVPALDMGLITPATVYDDSPVQLLDGKLWPVNSFGYYRGLTTVYEALEDSVNTVAVRVLQDVTVYSSYEYLHDRFGITSIVAQREVNGQVKSDLSLAPLAMGGLTDGITPLEMTAAYATFGNNGVYNSPRTYSLVLDSNGATVLEKESESRVAIKE